MNSVSYNAEILQRLSAFVLNRTTDNLRSDLHEYLVMMSLATDEKNRGLTKGQISYNLKLDNIDDLAEFLEKLKAFQGTRSLKKK